MKRAMNKHACRIIHDLYLTACYLLIAHSGYNLADRIQNNQSGYYLIPLWILGAGLVFMHTKEVYDKKKKEAKD